MTNAAETFEDEYEEYDEFDDEDDERGLSGFAVLIMGLVMIGAFFSVVWIAYQQGIKTGQNGVGGNTPFVAAEPEPIKIETADASEPVADREVYDVFDGDDEDAVTVLAEGPEEPVDRTSDDPIGDLASVTSDIADDVSDGTAAVSDEVQDRLASLAEEDAAALDDASDTIDLQSATEPTQITTPVEDTAPPTPSISNAGPLSGTHVVQIGAFRSNGDAMAQWGRIQSRLGDYVDGKSPDIEVADLGDRGVYHRLRIGPFASSSDASSYCAGLKERGQDCLIKAN